MTKNNSNLLKNSNTSRPTKVGLGRFVWFALFLSQLQFVMSITAYARGDLQLGLTFTGLGFGIMAIFIGLAYFDLQNKYSLLYTAFLLKKIDEIKERLDKIDATLEKIEARKNRDDR